MSVPRLLLLTAIAPGRINIGRIYVRDWCLLYPRDQLRCVHLHPLAGGAESPELEGVPTTFIPAPPEHGYQKLGRRFARLIRPLLEVAIDVAVIPRLIHRIVAYGRSQRVELVCAILHAPTSIRIAKRVADALGVPLVTLVWDPPEVKLPEFGLDRLTRTRLMRTFRDTIRASLRCGVASEVMKGTYESDHGTRCVILRYGLRRPELTTTQPPADAPLVVGFAGAMYTPTEWDAFLKALAGRHWRIAGREVLIKVFGSRIQLRTNVPVRVEFLGWRESGEMLRLLSAMDIAYMPYWFDESYREEVELSFPSKVSTYVTARVPIFYHGPRRAALVRFLERFPIGAVCHSLDAHDIAESLERFIADPHANRQAKLACDEAYEHELSASVFRQRFAELIGVGQHELNPVESLEV